MGMPNYICIAGHLLHSLCSDAVQLTSAPAPLPPAPPTCVVRTSMPQLLNMGERDLRNTLSCLVAYSLIWGDPPVSSRFKMALAQPSQVKSREERMSLCRSSRFSTAHTANRLQPKTE